MVLTKTRNLIATYGEALRNGTITDKQLLDLMKKGVFKEVSQHGYLIPGVVTDNHHLELDAIKNFVAVMGAQLDDDTLHILVTRMFNLIPAGHLGDSLTNTHLAKTFLAYEMSRDAVKAKSLYQSDKFKTEFNNPNIELHMNKLLEPLITYFKMNRHSVTSSSSSISLSSQQEPLIQEIKQWIAKRKKEGDILERNNQDRQYFTLWSCVFTGMSEKVKLAAANKMLDHLSGNTTRAFNVSDIEALRDQRLGIIIAKLEQAQLLPEAFVEAEVNIEVHKAMAMARSSSWGRG